MLKVIEVNEILEGKDEKYKVFMEVFDVVLRNVSGKLKWSN